MKVPVKRTRFTDSELQEIVNSIHARGASRARHMGNEADNASFIAGVGSVFEAMGLWDRLPPIWLINAMSGRPVFNGEPPKVGRAEKH